MSDRPLVVLVGPPGAGKSTVGRLLGERRGVRFVDTDEVVESQRGTSVADIFVEEGEPVFRKLERAAVAEALADSGVVVALGGGAVLDPSTRSRLAGHAVVFLDVGLGDAVARVGLGSARPLLLGNVRGQLKSMLDARRPVYEEVADHIIRTDGLSAEQVADEVDGWLAE